MANYKYHILLCGGTGCTASESPKIKENFINILAEKNLSEDVQVIATGCFGFCEKGPIVKILPDNTFYTQVKPEDCREIIDEHIIKGCDWILTNMRENGRLVTPDEESWGGDDTFCSEMIHCNSQ